KNLLHHHTHQYSANGSEQVRTFWCGCGVIRREVYLQAGGLSEFYNKPSIADIEIGVRLHATGNRLSIFPKLHGKNRKRWSFKIWLYTDVFCRGIPWVRLMRATHDWTSQLNFSWVQRIATLAAAVLIACVFLVPVNPQLAATIGSMAFVLFLIPNIP